MTLFFAKILRYLFIAELMIFSLLYFFGPNGIYRIEELRLQKHSLIDKIDFLKNKNEHLLLEISKSRSDFSKEKMARERLLMKRPDEVVYFRS